MLIRRRSSLSRLGVIVVVVLLLPGVHRVLASVALDLVVRLAGGVGDLCEGGGGDEDTDGERLSDHTSL
jgi:hypothetical protein